MNKTTELKKEMKKLLKEIDSINFSLTTKQKKVEEIKQELIKLEKTPSKREFWETIEEMNWSHDNDDKRISSEIKKGKYGSLKNLIQFKKEYDEKYEKLYNFIENTMTEKQYDRYIGCSDDGLWDFISNIIGIGEESYNEVMSDYKKFKNYSAVENFSYSFQIIDEMKQKKESI